MILLKEYFFSQKLFSLLFILLPVSLISGPFLPDLFLSLISIYGLYHLLFIKKYNKKYFFNNYFIYAFFIFYLWILFSSLVSNQVLLSLESSLFYIRYPFFIFGSLIIFEKYEDTLRIFFLVIINVIFFLLIDLICEIVLGHNLVGIVSPQRELGRYSGFFRDELVLGKYTSLLYLYGVIGIVNFKRGVYKFKIPLLLIYIASVFVLILFSSERTALGLFLISVFYILILTNLINFKIKIIFSITFVIISALVLSFTPSIKSRIIDNTINQFLGIHKDGDDFSFKLFSIIHELHYKTSIKMFLDNPITGIGPKVFRAECDNDKYIVKLPQKYIPHYEDKNINGCSIHPHHFYLQLLAETGIVGFFIILTILLSIMIKFIKNHKDLKISKTIVCLIIIINVFPLVPSNSFFNNWINVFLFIPFPVLIYYESNNFEFLR